MGDGKTGAIHADAVAEGGVGEDFRTFRDGQGCAVAAGCGGVVGGEICDSLRDVISDETMEKSGGIDSLPIVSTNPVNMLDNLYGVERLDDVL